MTSRPSEEKIKQVLQIIKEDVPAAAYFFHRVRDPFWFDILKKEGFFSPEKVPGPMYDEIYQHWYVLYWKPLDYLEKLAQHVQAHKDEELADKLIEVIKDITKYHIEHDGKIDNYHVWASFIRILSCLPIKKITNNIIDFIPVWLKTRFSSSVVVREIRESLLPKLLSFEGTDEHIEKAKRVIEFLKSANKIVRPKLFVYEIYYELLAEFLWDECPAEKVEKVRKIIRFIKEQLVGEGKNPFKELVPPIEWEE